MSQTYAGYNHFQSSQSAFLKFFSESVKIIERRISSTADSNLFTIEQLDFVVLICDQFQKLVKLRHKSKFIDNHLSYNFPEFFKPTDQNSSAHESAFDSTAEPADKQKENEVLFVCDVCDEEVPILNNDPNHSTQLHLNSRYHLEVVSVLRKIRRESEASTISSDCSSIISTTNLAASNSLEKPSDLVSSRVENVPNGNSLPTMKSNEQSKQLPVSASSPISNAEESFQRFAWIKEHGQSNFFVWRHSMYHCCLCDVNLPSQHNFDAHVGDSTHKTNIAAKQVNLVDSQEVKNVTSLNSLSTLQLPNLKTNQSKLESLDGPTILLDCTEMENSELSLNYENVLKYIVQSNGIFKTRKDKYVCSVCCCYIPLEKYVSFHLKSRVHRERIREYAEYSKEAKKNHLIAVDPDIFTIHLDKLYCLACEVNFFDPHTFLSHASKQHDLKLMLDFPIVKVGTNEFCSLCDIKVKRNKSNNLVHVSSKSHYINYLQVSSVIQLNGIKFCSLCSVTLFTESQYNSHVNDDSHISNLKNIKTIVEGI